MLGLGGAYRQLGQYEEGEATFKKALQLYGTDDLLAHLQLATTYASMGGGKKRGEAVEVLGIDPTFSAESWARRLPLKDPKVIADIASALRKAGLK